MSPRLDSAEERILQNAIKELEALIKPEVAGDFGPGMQSSTW